MADKKSTQITNITNSPVDFTDVGQVSGRERVAQGTMVIATGEQTANDVWRLARLPVRARITDIRVKNDDLDSGGTPALDVNVGVFDTDGSAKSNTAYASASTQFQSASSTGWTSLDERTAEKPPQRLWEDAGDSDDPGGEYEVGIEVNTAPATAQEGDIAYQITWVID